MGKKRFIDPSKSVKFQLVHRSQRDPKIADETASKLVLRPIAASSNLARKGKGLDLSTALGELGNDSQFDTENKYDQESDYSDSDTENELDSKDASKKLKAYVAPVTPNDPALYGIFFKDQESYDYMQHLKPIGSDPTAMFVAAKSVQKPEKEEIKFVEANTNNSTSSVDFPQAKLILPEGVLPSQTEEDVGLLTRLAQPYTPGLNLELGDDVRETLYALDDDEYVEDELEDDFFGALDAEEIPEQYKSMVEQAENGYENKDNENQHEDQEWMKEYARFQKSAGKPPSHDDIHSDGSDSTDATPKAPVRTGDSVRIKKGAFTDTSSYSMSSSSMFRNDKLTLLDDRFDKVLAEYSDDEIGELDPDDPEVQGVLDAMSTFSGLSKPSSCISLGADSDSSRRLDVMFDDFLESTQVVSNGRALIPARQPLDALYSSTQQNVKSLVDKYAFEEVTSAATQAELDKKIYMPEEKNYDTWDVESVLSTYSNIYNRPKLIREISKNAPRIQLKGPHGMPSVVPSISSTLQNELSDDYSDNESQFTDCTERHNTAIGRNKSETAEEKRQRKAQVKAERRDRRTAKKMTKSAFKGEELRQSRLTSNHERQDRSFGLV
ncbi:hypothetical protein BATDEDRAFT_34791 [Batrachochytrium dendrobatidis JAM81]|uniref:Low temperature viability protein n=2 Tax=Batrachochytrium dendrobatidis TaxID=109871 RepID=F4P028_BATDJ|nr:uncharacterized protein BATDEDRAFT_34791 [Batrachochytrium dendrobatidis JAM81]EGF81192.1 hypothetical protein BATDEDRAFT_34791 [Batrachochytrium dendrobatidis JAM81]OAJ38327.1 hypothetical protein BDEG_22274 [Batrachochytrium dendrobatidis JEL423]|eukprot:XP_006678006.1 hypothetical protein BATDEDRAFT_34791 [Batrachochytrium dendrobatidis JAM81]